MRMRTGPLGVGDRRAVTVLLAVPVVVLVVPALFGHAVVNADNQIQNFPLRALAGEDLRHGHLPLWNPYIWSGSPLLGGLNAGALYPFTWLFAVLPAVAAWTVNLVVVYVTTATGMYAFLRQQSLRPVAAGFAAASFAFAGSMSAQMVHIGIVQGVSWIPWMLLVEQRLARQLLASRELRRRGDHGADRTPSVWRRVTLLGVLGGLVLLTGEPRGMADAAVVVGLAALWHVTRRHASWRARAAFFGSFVSATVVAAAIGAVQLVPGWSFIANSQRAQSTVAFFGTGSLPVRWSVLMLVPDLLGGTGVLNQPLFFSHYNLPEVTGYVGLVPLMAAAGLLARAFGSRRHRWARRWTPWFGLVVIGMVLTYGQYTPLGTVLAHLPFYGDLRLQSRNIVIADLALCVLLAYWLDSALDPSVEKTARRSIRIVTAAPAVAVAVTCLVALSWPAAFEAWLGVTGSAVDLGRTMAPWFAGSLLVAVAAVVVALRGGRLSSRPRAVTLGALITVDLLFFTVTSVTSVSPTFPAPQLPTTAGAVPVGAGSRFAVFDPANEYLPELSSLGQNDLNTLVHIPSVEGYGSLTDSGYQNATGTRTHNTLSPCALAQGTFVPLDLSTVLTVADDLIQERGQPASTLTSVPETACPVTPPTSEERVWWFGRTLSVQGASVTFAPHAPLPSTVRVGVLSGSGATVWTPATVTTSGGVLAIRLATATVGSGLVLAGGGVDGATDTSSVTTAAGGQWIMDGLLQSALRDAAFRFTGYRDGIAVFRTAVREGPVSLVPARTPPTGTAPAGTAAKRTSSAPSPGTARRVDITPWGDETDAVTVRRPATLVRSEAFSSGWQARVRDVATRRTVTVPVLRIGLIEGVRLDPGVYTVTWTYQPASVTDGLVGTSAGSLVAAAAAVTWLWRRRRGSRGRRGRRRRAPVTETATRRAPSARWPAVIRE
jgi:hypothetical protein